MAKKKEAPKYGGNAGEWGELYALLKLLADGSFYSADRNLNIINEEKFPVIAAYRNDQMDDQVISFEIDKESKRISVSLHDKQTSFSQESFKNHALHILQETKKKRKELPELLEFWASVFYPKFKEKSESKSDLGVKIYDPRVKVEKRLGFSVKSKVGSDPTLFNSNGTATNLRYKIHGYDKLSAEDKEYANTVSNKKLIRHLYDKGCTLSFLGMADERFHNNIRMIDSSFDQILGEAVLHSYVMTGGKMSEVVDHLNKANPCKYPSAENNFYEYKTRQFLLAAALGMTSVSVWQGIIDATGGFIVVREDGELLCYHIYNWNDLQDYLFDKTYFDQPSTGRHAYGKINSEKPDEILLNFQIKFK